MKCSFHVPSHITGFFQIINHQHPLRKGSRGAGVVLDKGVNTTVKIKEGQGKVKIETYGKFKSKNFEVSRNTIRILKEQYDLDNVNIHISHDFQVPLGAGFGASAACSLGTVLGLVHCLDLPLTKNQAGAIAHQSEVELNTGLGDVISELSGGIVLRTREGAPGWGALDQLICPPSAQEIYVICKSLGSLDTAKIISDPSYQERINRVGEDLLHKLIKHPNPSNFLKLSRRFAEDLSLMNKKLRELIEIMDEETIGSSMAMLGNTAFAFSKSPEISLDDVIIARIDECGCKVIED